jgi:hypothetical protein
VVVGAVLISRVGIGRLLVHRHAQVVQHGDDGFEVSASTSLSGRWSEISPCVR